MEKRYIETLENLKEILLVVDYVKIYANSKKYKICYSKFLSSYIKACENTPN